MQIIVVAQKGSKEETIASQYGLKVVPTKNIPSIGKAWNIAIEHATGDYLTTANCDDRYLIGGLKRMAEVLDNNPDVGLVFSQVDIDDGENQFPWQRINNDTGEVEDIRKVLETRCIIGPMPMWRKSLHNQIGLFNEVYTVASDYDMWRRMAEVTKFYYIAESMGVYMKRADSLEHRNPGACRLETKLVQL